MATERLQLAILISGTGRSLVNMQQCIDAGTLDAEIRLLISSRGDVLGVTRARDLGLETMVIERRELSADEFQRRLTSVLLDAGPGLICMAGFLSLWRIPDRFDGRVINIHPALLPDFGGKGMYGHHVHEAVLKAGRVISGCSVHFCDNEYDHGPIILRRQVPVKPGDTPDDLATRVFVQECIAYPEAVQLFADDRVRLDGRTVTIT